MSPLPIENIGKYRVDRLIGSGGFGTVFACVDERLETEVAIKVLADNHSVDANIRARFLSEGRILRQIDNPHLITVYDVGETDRGQPYLVLELADRGELSRRVESLRSDGWQPVASDVIFLADTLLNAAAALHQKNLVHRDINPNNILLRSTSQSRRDKRVTFVNLDERLLVADLGLAKDLSSHSGFTVAGGTPNFSAPEQFSGDLVTARSDIYAIARIIEWFVESVDPETSWRQRLQEALQPALSTNVSDRPTSAMLFMDEIHLAIAEKDVNKTHKAGAKLGNVGPSGRPVSVTTDRVGSEIPIPIPEQNTQASSTSSLHVPTQIYQPNPAPFDTQDSQRSGGTPAFPDLTQPRENQPNGRILRWMVGAVVLGVALLVVGYAIWLALDENSGREQRSGEVIELVEGSAPIRIDGPEQIVLGRTATIRASGPGGASYRWTLPDGSELQTEQVEITAESVGTVTLALEVTLANGDNRELTYTLEVVEGT